MSNTTYITNEGDTWTGISFKAYGTTSKVQDILAENPMVGCDPVLPGGIKLKIPVLDKVTINKLNLPPWKR